MIVPPGIVGWIGGEAKLGTTLVTRASGREPGERLNRHDRTWIGNKREGAGRDEPGRRLATCTDFCRMDFRPSTQQTGVTRRCRPYCRER